MTQATPSPRSVLPSSFARRERRAVPAHLKPPRSEPTAPNGLKMSRTLSAYSGEFGEAFGALRAEFAARTQEMQEQFQARLDDILSGVATAETRAEASQRALRDAIESSRNDEESRMLRQENERQHEAILALQGELARLRAEQSGLALDKGRYFRALGESVGEVATELQDAGERLAELADARSADPGFLRALAARLTTMGEDLGEFGENSLCYADQALANAAD